jgi:hypothetical protein
MIASKLLATVLAIAIVLSVNAPVSFALASHNASSVCAREVPSGSIVDPLAGRITLPNGSTVALANIVCSMTSVVWTTTGNAAYGTLTISSPLYYTNFQDQWTSPPAPSSGSFSSPQGVGLWNGLENANDVVQPLLVYGCIISSDCSNSWRLTAYALFGSTIYYVTPLSPSQGDTIQGVVTYSSSISGGSGCSGTQPGYTLNAKDTTASTSVSLSVCTSDQYQTAVAGSIEVHSLSTCTQMPNTGSDSFSSLSWTTSGSSSATEHTGSDVSFCSASASWDNSNPNNIVLNLSWTHS